MDCPILVSRAPILCLVVDFLGVCFPAIGIFILPLLFALPIQRLFASLFITLDLDFPFSPSFTVSRSRNLEILGKFEVVVFYFLNHGGKCNNMFLL